MRKYSDAYSRATGVHFYPGSLNVLLDRPWQLPDDRLRLSADEAGVAVNLVPCQFYGTDAFIFRTDRAEAGQPHERRVLEIVSPLHLRAIFGLHDGEIVEVELP